MQYALYSQLAKRIELEGTHRFRTHAVLLLTLTLKPGFHYPSWRPELTALVDGWLVSITREHGRVDGRPVSTSRVDGPCWRPVLTGNGNRSPVNSGC